MKSLLLIFTLILLTSCAHSDKDPSQTDIQVVQELKGHSYGNIYFSAQPSKNELNALKESGFVAVINLRQKKESKYNESWEREIVKSQGIHYYNIPFSMSDEIDDEYIDAVTSKILSHREDGKVLVHCSSGNRVAVWIGAHFKKDHGLSSDAAFEKAMSMGLTKKMAQEKLKSYLYK